MSVIEISEKDHIYLPCIVKHVIIKTSNLLYMTNNFHFMVFPLQNFGSCFMMILINLGILRSLHVNYMLCHLYVLFYCN